MVKYPNCLIIFFIKDIRILLPQVNSLLEQDNDRSPDDVYLYHFSKDTIINHFKYSVKERLRPLRDQEMNRVEKVKDAYLEYKSRYFRHLVKYRASGFSHVIPTEFLGLSHTAGGGPWESFHGDPDWELLRKDEP